MNTAHNIPLLTDIIQLGDNDMKNHFDGHAFDEDEHLDDNDAAPIEELITDDEHIPVISVASKHDADIDELQINILNNDIEDLELAIPELSEAAETIEKITLKNETNIKHKTALNNLSKDELKNMITLLVSDAVDSTLPIIEAQLKQRIAEQILQKLSR